MGVGKTTVCQALKKTLPRAVFLDGDWCWDADPFVVTDETKAMVLDNIAHLLGNFLRCTAYENVIFGWVMHEQAIIDDILSRLDTRDCAVKTISLIASEEALTARLQSDIDAGIRAQDVLTRSVARIPLYESLDTIKIDTSELSVSEIVNKISSI